ncbi:MAG: hypothetical protein IKK93_03330 [Campylobacter sp.]|nr:hypothetical protein [Campylobacter sp.]
MKFKTGNLIIDGFVISETSSNQITRNSLFGITDKDKTHIGHDNKTWLLESDIACASCFRCNSCTSCVACTSCDNCTSCQSCQGCTGFCTSCASGCNTVCHGSCHGCQDCQGYCVSCDGCTSACVTTCYSDCVSCVDCRDCVTACQGCDGCTQSCQGKCQAQCYINVVGGGVGGGPCSTNIYDNGTGHGVACPANNFSPCCDNCTSCANCTNVTECSPCVTCNSGCNTACTGSNTSGQGDCGSGQGNTESPCGNNDGGGGDPDNPKDPWEYHSTCDTGNNTGGYKNGKNSSCLPGPFDGGGKLNPLPPQVAEKCGLTQKDWENLTPEERKERIIDAGGTYVEESPDDTAGVDFKDLFGYKTDEDGNMELNNPCTGMVYAVKEVQEDGTVKFKYYDDATSGIPPREDAEPIAVDTVDPSDGSHTIENNKDNTIREFTTDEKGNITSDTITTYYEDGSRKEEPSNPKDGAAPLYYPPGSNDPQPANPGVCS